MSQVEYVVQPQGELDIATVPALLTEWLQAVEQEQPELFVVDLRDVTYLDSTTLGAIVAVRKQQQHHGGRVIVTNAQPRLSKLFQISGLDGVIEVSGPVPRPSEDRGPAEGANEGANRSHRFSDAD